MRKLSQWLKKHATLIKIIFFGIVLFFVANQVRNIAHGMSFHDILLRIKDQSRWALLGMFTTGLVGLLPMVLYDRVAEKSLVQMGSQKLTKREFLVAAWTTNTINNLAGFGGVIGASLRANFYGKGLERKKVIATVSKIALFMLSGLSLLALVTSLDLMAFRHNNPFYHYRWWLLLGGFFAPVLLTFVYNRRKTLFKEFRARWLAELVVASTGQWLGAMAVFLVVGYLMQLNFSIIDVYPMFVIATGLGMLTMVPGGAGTFDVMMILGLGHLGLSQSSAVVWILFYRIFYYFIPFVTGIIIYLTNTSVKLNRYFDNLPRVLSQKIAHTCLVVAVYFAGIMMILLSTFTNLSNLSRLFEIVLPFSFDFLDQTLNLLIGFLLLGLARGISQKVEKAFWPTIALLIFGIVNTVSRTASVRLITVYVIILLIVWASRKEFYRQSFAYSWGAIVTDGLLFGILLVIYAVAGYHSGQIWSSQAFASKYFAFPSEDIWISGMLGVVLSIICLATLYQFLTTKKEIVGEKWDEARFNHLQQIYGGTAASHYLRLSGYSYFYYQEDGKDQMIFGFQPRANKCFVLGDPLGNPEKWQAATIAFMEYVDKLGYQLAFYKISEEYVLLLHDLGFHFDKIGETGVTDFSCHHQEVFSDRFGFERLAKLGYQFRYYQQPTDELLSDLTEISDEWLSGEKEKHFSVGRFDKQYLKTSGIGVALNPEGELVGFISQQPITKDIVSYDLLRYKKDLPNELSTFLKLHLMDKLHQMGFKEVYQGMAPLAKVGETSFAFLGERVMNLIYKYGHSFYDFQQVTEEKNPYVDYWRPRYFAYMKSSSFVFSASQLLILIGRGKGKATPLSEEMIEL